MKTLAFYIPFSISILSLGSLVILGIAWSRKVDSLLGMLPSQQVTPDLHLGPMVSRVLRLARQSDKRLAAQLHGIFYAQIIALLLFLACGVLALVIGCRFMT